jgi:hypothetical protein
MPVSAISCKILRGLSVTERFDIFGEISHGLLDDILVLQCLSVATHTVEPRITVFVVDPEEEQWILEAVDWGAGAV